MTKEIIRSKMLCLLCSRLGLDDTSVRPLSPKEWHSFRLLLIFRQTFAWDELFLLSPEKIQTFFHVSPSFSHRVFMLIAREPSWKTTVDQLEENGISIVTLEDDHYPVQLKRTLKAMAPPILYVRGSLADLPENIIAVTGKRDLEKTGQHFARFTGRCCAQEGIGLVSGFARGSDRIAMESCWDSGGRVIGVVPDNLIRYTRNPSVQAALDAERLTLITPYHPFARFTSGKALGRNKVIYGLSKLGLVIAVREGSGGTWHGVQQVLKHQWIPIIIRQNPAICIPDGLIQMGAVPVSETEMKSFSNFYSELKTRAQAQLKFS